MTTNSNARLTIADLLSKIYSVPTAVESRSNTRILSSANGDSAYIDSSEQAAPAEKSVILAPSLTQAELRKETRSDNP
jgi:hypothetical protein